MGVRTFTRGVRNESRTCRHSAAVEIDHCRSGDEKGHPCPIVPFRGAARQRLTLRRLHGVHPVRQPVSAEALANRHSDEYTPHDVVLGKFGIAFAPIGMIVVATPACLRDGTIGINGDKVLFPP